MTYMPLFQIIQLNFMKKAKKNTVLVKNIDWNISAIIRKQQNYLLRLITLAPFITIIVHICSWRRMIISYISYGISMPSRCLSFQIKSLNIYIQILIYGKILLIHKSISLPQVSSQFPSAVLIRTSSTIETKPSAADTGHARNAYHD